MRRSTYWLGALMTVAWIVVGSANAEVTGNLALTSNYVSRGVSYSDNAPAVQGGVDYSHSSGIYVGAWGSGVDFDTPTRIELDVYGGITRPITDGSSWDIGVAYYSYPGDSTTNYHELYVGLTYTVLTAKWWFTPDYFGTGGDEQYWDGELKWELPHAIGVNLHAGYSVFDPAVGIKDYADYQGSVSYTYQSVTFELSYTTTNQDQFGTWDDGHVVATVTAQF
ncbi:MAG: TorF family putative porin [Nitrospirota bacterium]